MISFPRAFLRLSRALTGGHTVHDLKTHPEPFGAVKARIKTHEFRRDDRCYQVGDVLRLREWQPKEGHPDGGFFIDAAPVLAEVTYLTRGPAFGVPDGFAVLSIRVLE